MDNTTSELPVEIADEAAGGAAGDNIASIEWRQIKQSKYLVSNYGTIRGVRDERPLHPALNGSGYAYVTLYLQPGVQSHHHVHRLVAEAFLPNPAGHPHVHHIDGRRSNNVLSNLQWVSVSENRMAQPARTTPMSYGRKVHQISPLTGSLENEWRTAVWASQALGIPVEKIRAGCDSGQQVAGWRWIYAPDEELEGEIWCDVRGCRVSSAGRVCSSLGIITYGTPGGAYLLHKDHFVHRLVAEAFCPHPDGCDIVNHIDLNPHNNDSNNLEWTTSQGNSRHSVQAQTIDRDYRSRPVEKENIDGSWTWYESMSAAMKATGCSIASICHVCKGRALTAGKCRWRYAAGAADVVEVAQPREDGRRKGRAVETADDGVYLRFKSAAAAAAHVGVTSSAILSVCRGRCQSAGKRIWRYVDEGSGSEQDPSATTGAMRQPLVTTDTSAQFDLAEIALSTLLAELSA